MRRRGAGGRREGRSAPRPPASSGGPATASVGKEVLQARRGPGRRTGCTRPRARARTERECPAGRDEGRRCVEEVEGLRARRARGRGRRHRSSATPPAARAAREVLSSDSRIACSSRGQRVRRSTISTSQPVGCPQRDVDARPVGQKRRVAARTENPRSADRACGGRPGAARREAAGRAPCARRREPGRRPRWPHGAGRMRPRRVPAQTTFSPAVPTNHPSGHEAWKGPPRMPPAERRADDDRKPDSRAPVRLGGAR